MACNKAPLRRQTQPIQYIHLTLVLYYIKVLAIAPTLKNVPSKVLSIITESVSFLTIYNLVWSNYA